MRHEMLSARPEWTCPTRVTAGGEEGTEGLGEGRRGRCQPREENEAGRGFLVSRGGAGRGGAGRERGGEAYEDLRRKRPLEYFASSQTNYKDVLQVTSGQGPTAGAKMAHGRVRAGH